MAYQAPEIKRLQQADRPAAAALCARAMRDNPIHVHCFGTDPQRRQQRLLRFFRALLTYTQRRGLMLGAWADQQLIGLVGALAPGACRPSWADLLRLTPGMVVSNSPLGLWRTTRWLWAWLRADPNEPHWHMGPLAVARPWRGRGVAVRLGRQICNRLAHDNPAPLYLETDTQRNVRLYRRFGFTVVGHRYILNRPSWLMMREGGPLS